jgi:hypothetical protein
MATRHENGLWLPRLASNLRPFDIFARLLPPHHPCGFLINPRPPRARANGGKPPGAAE